MCNQSVISLPLLKIPYLLTDYVLCHAFDNDILFNVNMNLTNILFRKLHVMVLYFQSIKIGASYDDLL